MQAIALTWSSLRCIMSRRNVNELPCFSSLSMYVHRHRALFYEQLPPKRYCVNAIYIVLRNKNSASRPKYISKRVGMIAGPGIREFIEYLPKCIVIIVFWVSGERDFSPRPDTPIAASCHPLRISPHIYRPSLPAMIPAGFLTITAYSRLGLPSLRMVPYRSAPPLKK